MATGSTVKLYQLQQAVTEPKTAINQVTASEYRKKNE
jgi:hypothetical protein